MASLFSEDNFGCSDDLINAVKGVVEQSQSEEKENYNKVFKAVCKHFNVSPDKLDEVPDEKKKKVYQMIQNCWDEKDNKVPDRCPIDIKLEDTGTDSNNQLDESDKKKVNESSDKIDHDKKTITMSKQEYQKKPDDYKSKIGGKEHYLVNAGKKGTMPYKVVFESVELDEEAKNWKVKFKGENPVVVKARNAAEAQKKAEKNVGKRTGNKALEREYVKLDESVELDEAKTTKVKPGDKIKISKSHPFHGGKTGKVKEVKKDYVVFYLPDNNSTGNTPFKHIENVVSESVELDEAATQTDKINRQLKSIVDNHQSKSVKFNDGQMKVDAYTASAASQVIDALQKSGKKESVDKLERMLGSKAGFKQFADFAFKQMK